MVVIHTDFFKKNVNHDENNDWSQSYRPEDTLQLHESTYLSMFIQNDKQVFVIDLYICVRLQIADPNNHHVSPRIDSWENDSLNHWILR
jgi:hypothetical protein